MNDMFYAPRFDIRIEGLPMATDVSSQIISVTFECDLDIASMFTLTLYNPDNQLLDSALFDLGQRVEVYIGYGNDLSPMMLGEITALEPSFPESGVPTLRIVGYDLSYKMRNNQLSRTFDNDTDGQIVTKIAQDANLTPVIDNSSFFHRTPVSQANSDMAVLKDLAQANFFEVYVQWDKLYFQLPRLQTEAIVLEWGKNLLSFEPRISNASLAGSQVVRSYNEDLAQTIVAFATATDFDPTNQQAKLGSASQNLLLSLGRRIQRDEKVASTSDALTIAQSRMQEILDGMYEGSASCIGMPELQAGQYILIQGIGQRFSGTYRIRKATHTIDDSGYRTRFEVTQKSNTSLLPLLRKSLQDSPSPNTPERFYGVAIGIVLDNNDSKRDVPLGRVQVSYPWFSDQAKSSWARCATPMAGADIGMYFLPEVGDEVLVAFEQGNLANPIIIGSLWNGKKRPPVQNSDGKNAVRLIKTRSGHSIILDDTDNQEKIIISAKGGSQITMDKDGNISISAAKCLTLAAQNGSISLEAVKGNITLNAQSVDIQ